MRQVVGQAVDGTKAALLERYDRRVRWRAWALFVHAMAGVPLMMVWQDTLGKDSSGGTAAATGPTTTATAATATTAGVDDAGGWDFKLEKQVLEVIMLVSAVILAAQIAEYYFFQRRYETRSWFVPDSRGWIRHRWLALVIEVLLLLTVPFPGLSEATGRQLSAVMLLRIYTVARVVRCSSRTYRHRDMVLRSRQFRHAGTVEFSYAMAFRLTFISHPWQLIVCAVLYALVGFSYAMFIFERAVPPEETQPWTYRDAVWSTVITMTTVGYGDAIAYSQEGRIVASLAGLGGVILASILVMVVINALTPSVLERQAHSIRVACTWSSNAERHAAEYIQLWVRHWLWMRGKGLPVSNFVARNKWLQGKLRSERREFTKLGADAFKELGSGDGGSKDGDAAAAGNQALVETLMRMGRKLDALRSEVDHIASGPKLRNGGDSRHMRSRPTWQHSLTEDDDSPSSSYY
jgi:hypothetical protein